MVLKPSQSHLLDITFSGSEVRCLNEIFGIHMKDTVHRLEGCGV